MINRKLEHIDTHYISEFFLNIYVSNILYNITLATHIYSCFASNKQSTYMLR